MNFAFDPQKSDQNLRDRGFSFAFSIRILDSRTLEENDVRSDYGETRVKAIGFIDGRCYVVIYTDRKDTRRIISARIANRKERRQWHSSQ